jgi:hypothetical protein
LQINRKCQNTENISNNNYIYIQYLNLKKIIENNKYVDLCKLSFNNIINNIADLYYKIT